MEDDPSSCRYGKIRQAVARPYGIGPLASLFYNADRIRKEGSSEKKAGAHDGSADILVELLVGISRPGFAAQYVALADGIYKDRFPLTFGILPVDAASNLSAQLFYRDGL